MEFEQFRYIRCPNDNCDSNDVLESKYNLAAILKKFVVRAEKGPAPFRVYASAESFLKELAATPAAARRFHEVIFDGPQKLKFDIDASQEDLNKIALGHEALLRQLFEAICDAFLVSYQKPLSARDIVVCASHGQGKFSYHVIVNKYAVSCSAQAKEFTRRVLNYMETATRRFVDVGVNSPVQNFRIPTCYKNGRELKIVSHHDIIDALVSVTENCELLPDLELVTTPADQESTTDPAAVERVLEVCRTNNLLENFKFYRHHKGMYLFKRIRPSRCYFCERTHDKDNTLFVTTLRRAEKVDIYEHCRRRPGEKRFLGSYHVETPEGDPAKSEASLNDKAVAAVVRRILEKGPPAEETLFDTLPAARKHIYCEPKLRQFELADTLVVKAAMKMGKTKQLKEFIDRHFADGIKRYVIRFISFRQTFSGNIKEKFSDFVLYSEVTGPLSQSRLIVQVESLYRLDIRAGADPPDLLVLDECESIFEQFDSGLLRGNFNECFAKFQYLLKFSRHVICMDANVGDRTFRILQRLRPRFGAEGTIYHCNTYKNAAGDSYYFTGDKSKWLGLLCGVVESDERVAVPISSKSEAQALEKVLKEKFPAKRIKLYCGDTPTHEKREHFSNVNKYWSDADVLIYTPTVSAGVSFEQRRFAKLFGFFTDKSCPVETCIQMIGRIRDVADRQYYIYLQGMPNNLPEDVEEIKQWLIEKRENLVRNFDETGLRFEYNERGEFVYQLTDYTYVWMENTRVRNQSKNRFISKFVSMVTLSGAAIQHIDNDVYQKLTGESPEEICTSLETLHHLLSDTRQKIKEDIAVKIASARELEGDEAQRLKDLVSEQKDISEDDRLALEKYRLREDYNFSGRITAKFVARYRPANVRRAYKNLSRLFARPDHDEAIKLIQEEERNAYEYLEAIGQGAAALGRRWVFDKHRYALAMLRLCGWDRIDDPGYISRETLNENLKAKEELFWDNIEKACHEFDMPAPMRKVLDDDDRVEFMLKYINRILNWMYCVSISQKRRSKDIYYINNHRYFTVDPNVSEAREIPLIGGGK